MTSSDGAEAKPNTAMSTADLEVDSRDGTRSPPVVSPANSAPVSPSPGKPTISASHELNAEELVKSIEDIQSEFSNDVKRKLPDHFKPTPSSVICGRGKECFESEGNKRFRVIINSMLEEYTEAHGKSEKSKLVTKAMDIIRERSPEGAFVKREKGQWYEVSPRYAREKVGAWFRDCLSHRYKSSSKAKHAKKMSKRVSSYENNAVHVNVSAPVAPGTVMVDPRAVFNFPPNFAAQLEAHEQRVVKSQSHTAHSSGGTSLTSHNQAFYDIDDLSLIPFDSVDDF